MKNSTNLIQRHFTVDRGTFTQIYSFTTTSDIFSIRSEKNENANKLYNYFEKVFTLGYFSDAGSKSISSTELLGVSHKKTDLFDDLITMCADSSYQGAGRNQHDIVEKFFITFDPKTVAYEIPVWNSEYNGHIDLIRVVDNRIQILDFKPNAHKEKKASSQIFLYRECLSELTGINRNDIDCVYFDDKNAYLLI